MTMANEARYQANGERAALEASLRTALRAARGNVAIRERLRGIVADPDQLDSIVRVLGPRHALVRDLLAITRYDGGVPLREAG